MGRLLGSVLGNNNYDGYNRIGQKEKLNCCAVATEALAVSMGHSGPGIALQSCPAFRQGG